MIRRPSPDAEIVIEDLRGDGDHYAAGDRPGLRRQSRVQQHQMVYQALRGRMGDALHALALQTSAPNEISRPGLLSWGGAGTTKG